MHEGNLMAYFKCGLLYMYVGHLSERLQKYIYKINTHVSWI